MRARGALLALGVLALFGTTRAAAPEPAAPTARPNVVVISMDTTRADALSSYGEVPGLVRSRGVVTPRLDALAADGVRFERFYAHAPTTLSSHASMLSGLDPHGHAVPRNGFPIPPTVPLLSERLAAEGYDTIGVIGAMPLAAGMGLERGFRRYESLVGSRPGAVNQDRADDVVLRTEYAVSKRDRGKPLFLFVHFYDAHQPYDAPAPFQERFVDPAYAGPYRDQPNRLGPLREAVFDGDADPADIDHVTALYLAEVAYVDDAIGRLLDKLAAIRLLDRALVVVTADHGEVLSESPAYAFSHGTDVTDGVLRIPLIVRGYGLPIARGAVVRRQAEMSGLAPTIEDLVGLAPSLGHRASFASMLSPGPVRDDDGWPERPTRPVVMEATRPHREDIAPKWNNLDLWRGVKAGGWTVTALPRLGGAPALVGGPAGAPSRADAPVGSVLAGRLAAWDAAAPPFRGETVDDATKEMLRALGYVD